MITINIFLINNTIKLKQNIIGKQLQSETIYLLRYRYSTNYRTLNRYNPAAWLAGRMCNYYEKKSQMEAEI